VRELAMTLEEGVSIARHPGRLGPGGRRNPEGRVDGQTRLYYPERVEMRFLKPGRKGHGGQIRKGRAVLLGRSARTSTTGGGGSCWETASSSCVNSSICSAPVHDTLMGLGAMRCKRIEVHRHLGRPSSTEENMTIAELRCLLAVGARFDDRVIGNPKHFASVERKIIHLDIDPS